MVLKKNTGVFSFLKAPNKKLYNQKHSSPHPFENPPNVSLSVVLSWAPQTHGFATGLFLFLRPGELPIIHFHLGGRLQPVRPWSWVVGSLVVVVGFLRPRGRCSRIQHSHLRVGWKKMPSRWEKKKSEKKKGVFLVEPS